VTKPFNFEGGHRMKLAEKGIQELSKYVDTLIVIPNQNLFKIASESTTFSGAFKLADDVLYSGVRGITDLMLIPGLINLDFADIQTAMGEMGKAMMGSGEASGEDRAIKAAEAAISNPLLEHSSMKGAKSVLINITGGNDMTLFEVDEAANRIREEIENENANIIFGSTYHSDLNGKIRVSVVATGIEDTEYKPYKFAQNEPTFFHEKASEQSNEELESIENFEEEENDSVSIEVEPQKKSIGGFISGIFKKMMSDETTKSSSQGIIPEEFSEVEAEEYDEPTFTRKKEENQS